MDLATWRRTQPRGALQALAHKTKIRWQTLADIATGKAVPRVETAKAIEAATDGIVTAAELLGVAPREPEAT